MQVPVSPFSAFTALSRLVIMAFLSGTVQLQGYIGANLLLRTYPRSCFPVDSTSGLFQRRYDCAPARESLYKINTGLYLGKHTSRSKMPFDNIFFRFVGGYIAKESLIGLLPVDCGFFYLRKNQQNVRVKVFCKKLCGKVLVNYRRNAFKAAVLFFYYGNAAAAAGNYDCRVPLLPQFQRFF